jgi:hypothetical protein
LSTHWPVTTKNTGKYGSTGDKKKPHVCIKQTKSDSYLTYDQSCKTSKLYPKKYYKETCMFYENVTWDGNIKKKLERYTNCKHCIAVDLILKHKHMIGRRLNNCHF